MFDFWRKRGSKKDTQVSMEKVERFHPELADKFRQLKKKLDAEQKIEVDLDMERQLVEETKRKYDHIS